MTDARKLLLTRAIRGLADGAVSIVLATYLTGLGFSVFEVGAIITGTLLGSAALTLAVGLLGYRLSRRHVMVGAAVLMLLTGIGFAGFIDSSGGSPSRLAAQMGRRVASWDNAVVRVHPTGKITVFCGGHSPTRRHCRRHRNSRPALRWATPIPTHNSMIRPQVASKRR